MPHPDATHSWYEGRISEYQTRLDERRRQDDWLTRARAATFLPALALAIYAGIWSTVAWPWVLAAGLLVAAFIAVVRVHERVLHDIRELRHRLAMNQVQLARHQRRWEAISLHDVQVPPEHEAVADDLDLFGPPSLFQLIALTNTPFGQDTLRDWLLIPAEPPEIILRQQAVTYLAPQPHLREDLDLRGRMLGSSRAGTMAFVDWAEGTPVLINRSWLVWLTRLSAAAFVVAAGAGFAGLVLGEIAFLVVVALTCLNLGILTIFAGRIHDVLGRVASRTHDLRQYHPLLETIASLPNDVPIFARLHAQMGASPREPLEILASLMRLVTFADLRHHGLVGLIFYLSQIFLLTDFHVVALMERWQQKHGHRVRRWLEAVGTVEALSSLATLAHDNPTWTLPKVDGEFDSLTAMQLGHPLLPAAIAVRNDTAVRNDITVGPPGSFVLVTGSNMSGKSTLLRAVGLNVVLAQAGGPACATDLRLPPVDLATCMRIRDSLSAGVSFFMAELRRLKQIVDQSRAEPTSDGRRMLYLLDELLQGTNSAERHVAVTRIIGRLIATPSIGMISTHDLELARAPELKDACQVVHFRETFTGHPGAMKMTFDYELRPGLAPTTNALKLLEFVGLGDNLSPDRASDPQD
jgi:hypothetical protein